MDVAQLPDRMRRLLLLVLLFAPAYGFASDVVLVQRVTVEIGDFRHMVEGAKVRRGWLASWIHHRSDVREVTLRAVSSDGVAGQDRLYKGCTLADYDAPVGGGDSAIARSLTLHCQE